MAATKSKRKASGKPRYQLAPFPAPVTPGADVAADMDIRMYAIIRLQVGKPPEVVDVLDLKGALMRTSAFNSACHLVTSARYVMHGVTWQFVKPFELDPLAGHPSKGGAE